MLSRHTSQTSIALAAAVFDVFGAPVGRVLQVEGGGILIGSSLEEPLMWVRRRAIVSRSHGGLVLSCARNRLADERWQRP